MNLDKIYSQSEIKDALKSHFHDIGSFITPLSPEEFTASKNEKWSIAQEFEHIILSAAGVASALKEPKSALKVFGDPNRPVRNLPQVHDRYQERLAKTAAPPGNRFLPGQYETYDQRKMLADWHTIASKFAQRLPLWTEAELDAYLLPHPLMGRLILREMLFFTLFHSSHHLKTMKNKAMPLHS